MTPPTPRSEHPPTQQGPPPTIMVALALAVLLVLGTAAAWVWWLAQVVAHG